MFALKRCRFSLLLPMLLAHCLLINFATSQQEEDQGNTDATQPPKQGNNVNNEHDVKVDETIMSKYMETSNPEMQSGKLWLVIVLFAVIPLLLISTIVIVIVCVCRRKKKEPAAEVEQAQEGGGDALEKGEDGDEEDDNDDGDDEDEDDDDEEEQGTQQPGPGSAEYEQVTGGGSLMT